MSKIIGETFDDYVRGQIETRQQKLGLNQNNDLVNTYLTGRNSWIRLTSGINVSAGKCAKLGIPPTYQGNQLASKYILFNGVNSRDNISEPKGGIIDSYTDPLNTTKQYGFNSSTEYGLTPMPFIENIKVTPKNRGSLRIAEIKMKCFNKDQFNIIETLFMRLKYTFLLEWGHSMYFDNNGVLQTNPMHGIYDEFLDLTLPFDPSNSIIGVYPDVDTDANVTRIQNLITTQRKNSNGNYDAFLGWVQNFKWNLNSDYSYDINLKAVTYGDVIESLSITNPVEMEPIAGEDSETGSSPLARTLKKIKNRLDDEGFLKLSIENIKKIGELDNKPYVSLYDKNAIDRDAVKVGQWFNKDHYYIRLGSLIRMIEGFFYKYDDSPGNPIPINFFDTDNNTNFCSYINDLFSLDPRIFIIESEMKLDYYEYITGFKDDNTTKRPRVADLSELNNKGFKGFLDYKNNKGELVGLPLNIYVNIDMILDILDKNVDKEGNLPIFDFYKSIFNNIDKALGGITNLEFSYDEEVNTYFILDKNITTSPEEEFEEAALINVGLLTPNQGSFVLDVSIESTISNQMGSMLAIGAQSNNTDVGSNSIAISRWNEGLTDRVIPTKVTSYEEEVFGEDTGDINDLGALLSRYIIFSLEEKDINRLYSVGKNYLITKRDIAIEKDELPARFFIPISLNLTLDGISGPKIYQKYTVNDIILPQNYQDNIEFLIKGISHTVDNSGWKTSLESIGTPKPRQLKDAPPLKRTFVPGEKPSYAGGRPAVTTPPSDTPNADRLRNVLTQLGYTEKGDEIANGGDITANLADYAIAVFRALKSRNPQIAVRVTGGNDKYHTRLSYVSSHSEGNALDFTINPASSTNLKIVEDVLAQFAAGNRDKQASYINEYKDLTRAATGRHFHIRINGIDPAARNNIENIYTQAESGQIEPIFI